MRRVALLIVLGSCGARVDPDLGKVCRPAEASNPCDVDDLYVLDAKTGQKACGLSAAPEGKECRPSTGPCDPAEQCDGKSEQCPVDSLFNSLVICSTGTRCKSATRCSGMSAACPTTGNYAPGTPCRDAASVCDAPDVCDSNGSCPDLVADAGTACRAFCSGPSACGGTQYRCCTDVVGTCNASGSCQAASCICQCRTSPC